MKAHAVDYVVHAAANVIEAMELDPEEALEVLKAAYAELEVMYKE